MKTKTSSKYGKAGKPLTNGYLEAVAEELLHSMAVEIYQSAQSGAAAPKVEEVANGIFDNLADEEPLTVREEGLVIRRFERLRRQYTDDDLKTMGMNVLKRWAGKPALTVVKGGKQ